MIRNQETPSLPKDGIARIDAIVRRHAAATPDAPALREDGRTLGSPSTS